MIWLWICLIDHYVDVMVMNSVEADYQLYSLVSLKNLIIFPNNFKFQRLVFGRNVIASMLLLFCMRFADGQIFCFTIEA